MNLEKIKNMLSEFFDSPDNREGEIQQKLAQIIAKLEHKKNMLKEEMVVEGEKDETSEVYHELEQEYRVVSKLLKKAKKNYTPEPSQSFES